MFCLSNSSIKNLNINQVPVKFLGRTFIENNQLLLCYSATGIEFNFEGTYLSFTFTGDSTLKVPDSTHFARIAVYFNEERIFEDFIDEEKKEFAVFTGTEKKSGKIKLIKLSEAAHSICALEQINIDAQATISKSPDNKCKIEFIGDSITCGYGVEDLNREHGFSTRTEDSTKAFAYKTAKLLNADYSLVSISGWGIVSGYTETGIKRSEALLPLYYTKLAYTNEGKINNLKPQERNWDFSKFTPDFIVVNLGTNDQSYTLNKEERIKEYIDLYVDFLIEIRAHNPKAKIICCLGLMGQDLCQAVKKVTELYKEKTLDKEIYYLELPDQKESDGIAANWHPSQVSHTKTAKLLSDFIKSI